MSQRSFIRTQQRKAAAAARREALLRRRRASLVAGAAIGATALFAPAAHAATLQVTSLADGPAGICAADDCTLRSAIAAAAADDAGASTIAFASGLSGAIHLDADQGPLNSYVSVPLTIAGPGADRIQIDGGGATQLFNVDGDGGSLAISGLGLINGSSDSAGAIGMNGTAALTLTGDVVSGNVGSGSAGAIRASGVVTVTGSTFTANSAASHGGAIDARGGDYAPVTISGSTFTGNASGNHGGAVYLRGPSATISGSTFTGNHADNGGAIEGIAYDSSPTVSITGSTFSGNTASDRGAAIALHVGTTLTLAASTLSGNSAGDSGGALFTEGDTTVTGSTLTGNTAEGKGGALYATGEYGFLRVRDSVVSGNSAQVGGGIGLQAATADAGPSDITRSTITGNHADAGGGGVAIGQVTANGRLRVAESTISGNDATAAADTTGAIAATGGGLLVTGTVRGALEVRESTVSGNRAAVGAGIGMVDPNQGGGDGAASRASVDAPAVAGDGTIEVANSTIASNAATVSGGGIALDRFDTDSGPQSSTIGVTSSVVADNTAAGAAQDLDRPDDATGGGFDTRFSLVEAAGDAPLLQHASAPTIVGTDPQLGPLADNGGATQTQAPAITSPLVDQGHAPVSDETDQRGSARTYDAPVPNPDVGDGTDIGAVELTAANFVRPVPPVPQTPAVPPAPAPPAPQQFFATVAGKPLNTRGPANSLRTVVASLPGVTCSVSRDTIRRCTVAIRSTAAVRIPGRTALLPKGTLLAVGSSNAADGDAVASLLVKVKLTSAGTKLLAARPLGIVAGATVDGVTSAGTPQVQAAVRLLRSNSIRILVPGRPTTLPSSVTAEIDAAARVFRSAITVVCSAYSDAPRGTLTLTTMQARLACARVAKYDVDATLTPRGHSATHRLAPGASAARRAISRRIVLRFGL